MKSYLKIYLPLVTTILVLAGAINWLIDPLWYNKGNRITGRNFSFNERISKTNLLLNSDTRTYDCLILGSSRTTLLRSSSFHDQSCFNYAFSAGTIDEFAEYARFAKEKGINPKTVYVGVDAFNFSSSPYDQVDPKVVEPQPIVRAYLSLDVLMFSGRTLLGQSPDPRYYNQAFESEVIEDLPEFKPVFVDRQNPGACDPSAVQHYVELRELFPDAEFIGYVPPISAWNVVNESYERDVLECTLVGFHQVANVFDKMYDFSVPSAITMQPQNTYDGSHFYPKVHEQVAQVLQGKSKQFGILINDYTLTDYQNYYKSRVQQFLYIEGENDRWNG